MDYTQTIIFKAIYDMGVHSLTIHYYYKVHILKKKKHTKYWRRIALLQLDTIKGNKLTWPSIIS